MQLQSMKSRGNNMDLDNINDIEVLREAAKNGRVRLKKRY